MKMWITRDLNGKLWLHNPEPILQSGNCWESKAEMPLYSEGFPEVTFENSPQQVEIKLI